jgi:hypothetical protein
VPGWEQDPLWRLKRTVELAEGLGARVVVVHPPRGWLRISLRVTGASNQRNFWVGLPLSWFVGRSYARWLCDGLESFQRGTEVIVAVENMPRRQIGPLGFDLYHMTRLESLERFRHVSRPSVQLQWTGTQAAAGWTSAPGRLLASLEPRRLQGDRHSGVGAGGSGRWRRGPGVRQFAGSGEFLSEAL